MQAAEMMGVTRKESATEAFSRVLTYSGLLEQARFNNAAKLLGSTEIKIIDVALLIGPCLTLPTSRELSRAGFRLHPEEFRERSRTGQVASRSARLPVRK